MIESPGVDGAEGDVVEAEDLCRSNQAYLTARAAEQPRKLLRRSSRTTERALELDDLAPQTPTQEGEADRAAVATTVVGL